MWTGLFKEIVLEVMREYGVTWALIVFLVGLYNVYIHKLWTARLREKDREIKRIVEDRNLLQQVILGPARLTSGEEDDDDDADDLD